MTNECFRAKDIPMLQSRHTERNHDFLMSTCAAGGFKVFRVGAVRCQVPRNPSTLNPKPLNA